MPEKNYIIGESQAGQSAYDMSVKTKRPAIGDTHTIEIDLDNPPPLTPGEKWFDIMDWAGLGWIANAAIGMTIADTLFYGRGQPLMKGIVKTFQAAPVLKKFPDAAETAANLSALLAGGYAIMAPVKWVEDHKEGLVSWLDEGYKDNPKLSNERKQQIDARHEYLKYEPKQSWGSVMLGRTASALTILGAHYAVAPKKNLINYVMPKGKTFMGTDYHFNRWMANLRYGLSNKSTGWKTFFENMEHKLQRTPRSYHEQFTRKHPNSDNPYCFNESTLPLEFDKDTRTVIDRVNNDGSYILNTGESRLQKWTYNLNLETWYTLAVASMTYIFAKGFAGIFAGKGDPNTRQLVVEKTNCPEGITYTKGEYTQKLQQERMTTVDSVAQDDTQTDEALDNTDYVAEADAEKITTTYTEPTIAGNALAQTLATMHAKEAEAIRAQHAQEEELDIPDEGQDTDSRDPNGADGDITVDTAFDEIDESAEYTEGPDAEPPSSKVDNIAYSARQAQQADAAMEATA